MTASLTVQFTDVPATGNPDQNAVRSAVQTAFNEWTRHFDYTAGVYTINVTFKTGVVQNGTNLAPPTDAGIIGDNYMTVGSAGGRSLVETQFGLGFAARNGVAATAPALTLFVNPSNFQVAGSTSNIVAPLEREFSRALGVRTFIESGVLQPIPPMSRTVYDTNVQGTGQFIVKATTYGSPTFFVGPNVEAVLGGPALLQVGNTAVLAVGGGQTLNTDVQGAATVQPLDVALLRDSGLPALTDQELLEHAIARLYYGAFGRVADSAGLVQQTAGYQTALSGLVTVGDQLVGSAEFTARYGTLSDADFIRTVFQNVYGRPPTDADLSSGLRSLQPGRFGFTRGGLLSVYTQSDEARGRLSANANITYSGTAEAQVARLYDTAFGRDADPGGFVLYTKALINGTTLQQVAQSFLGSAEFANRYGTTPSDTALVNSLYQSTLGRTPDAAGQALYVQALAAGFSRADLVVGFSESQEHINLVAQRAGARDAAGYNVDLSSHLGIIPVISAQMTT